MQIVPTQEVQVAAPVVVASDSAKAELLATDVRGSLQTSRYLIPRFLPHRLRRHHAVGGLSLFHLRLDHALLR